MTAGTIRRCSGSVPTALRRLIMTGKTQDAPRRSKVPLSTANYEPRLTQGSAFQTAS